MNFVVFITILILFNLVNGELKLCTQTKVSSTNQLCKKMESKRPNWPPEPRPVLITPIVNIKDILDIDPNMKTLTVFIELILLWKDFEISVLKGKGHQRY